MSEQFWRRLSYIAGVFAIGAVFGITSFMASVEVKDLDLWLHLRMGQYISEHSAAEHQLVVPANDVLSCSIAGKPWVNHEWLFQVIVYQIWRFFGFDGLINMQIGIVFLTFLLLLLLSYNKDRQFLTAFFLLLVLLVYQTRFTIRPDIYSILFLVSFIWILSWFINRSWSVWALVLIQVIWSNMHGYFFFGPLLVLVAVLSELLKRHIPLPWQWNNTGRLTDDEYSRLKKLFFLLILACCVNPLTFKGAWYPVGVLLGLGHSGSKIFFAHITELQKPITATTIWTGLYGYYKIMIISCFVVFIINRRKIDISSVFIWIIFLLFSLVAVRNMIFFAIVSYLVFMVNIMTMDMKNVFPFRFSNNRFKHISGLLLKVLLIVWIVNNGTRIAVNGYFDFDTYERKSEYWGVSKRAYPYHAVDFLVKNQIKGNFFNDFNSGAYLIGRCSPNIKVYMDGRTEVYGGEFFEKRYQKIWREGNEKIFLEEAAKYNVTAVFLNNYGQRISPKALKMFYRLPGWKIVYFNYDAIIFMKDVPFNKVWIDRFSIDLNKWQLKPMDLMRLGTKRIDPLPLTSRAYLLMNVGLYDAALREIQEALKVSPDDFDSYKYLGEIYAIKKDWRRAFEYSRIATILRPYENESRLNLAVSYERLKNFKGAITQYDRVIELDSKNAKAYFGLARSYAMELRETQALKYLNQGQKLAPEDKVAVKEIHDIMEKNKRVKESKIKEPIKK